MESEQLLDSFETLVKERDELRAEVEKLKKENSELDEFTVKRVRVLAKVLDCEPGLPDDATIIGCMGTILGMFRARAEQLQSQLATLNAVRAEDGIAAVQRLTAAQQSAQEQLELAVDAANEWAMQYVEIDNAPMRVGDFIQAELSKGERNERR